MRFNPRSALLLVAALAITSLRLIHLGADTPPSLWTEGRAEFVDEGPKTLSARNLALFGETHWHPEDDYPGWMKGSPVTQTLFYLSFVTLGPTIEAARLVTVLWFLLFLSTCALLFARVYSPGLALLGVALLGLIHPLFIYSRNALFEVPLIACLFGPLFLVRRGGGSRPDSALLLLSAACLFATLGIKKSALIYFLPVLLVVAVHLLREARPAVMRAKLPVVAAAVTAVVGLVFSTHGIWSSRFFLSPRNLVAGVVASPLADSLPIVTTLGLVSAALLMLAWPSGVDQRPYVLALVSLAIIGPLLLGFFESRPLRYYIPLIPAYPLLLLECLDQKPWTKWRQNSAPLGARAVGAVCLILATAAFIQFLNRFVLSLLALEPAARPGYQGPIQLRYVILVSAAAGTVAWLARARIFRQRNPARLLTALTALALLIGTSLNAGFLSSPTYDRRELSSAIDRLVPPGKSIIGDLAPLLALGTGVPALNMFAYFNRASRFTTLRPDYLLYSENWPGMDEARELARATPEIDLGKPILEGSFQGLSVILYPLTYAADRKDASHTATVSRPR